MLDKHMREKHRIFKCDTCDFTSSSEVGLKIHKTKIHMQVIYKCDRCDFSCCSEWGLKVHVAKIHTCRYLYQCNKCVYRVPVWDFLMDHMKEKHSCHDAIFEEEDFLLFTGDDPW